MPKFTIIVFCILITLSGCGDSPTSPIDDEPAPLFHTTPSWLDSGTLVFRNFGVVDFGPGWADVHIPSSGIVKWNINTGTSSVLVPQGRHCATSDSSAKFCCVVGHGATSDLIIGNEHEWEIIEEATLWKWRIDLSLNFDSSLIAWRSIGNDHEVGVWVMDTSSYINSFIGPGDFPCWHPLKNSFIYRAYPELGRPVLFEYNFSTSETDTVLQFDDRNNGQYFCYSPSGNQIAYFGISLDEGESGVYVFDIISGEIYQINHHLGFGLCWGESGIVYNNYCADFHDPTCGVLWIVDTETWESRPLTQRLQFVYEEENIQRWTTPTVGHTYGPSFSRILR